MPRIKRIQRKTCLVVCEGKADKNFLLFLKEYYLNTSWQMKVESAGGDPNSVIRRAIKMGTGFDKVFCLSDSDRAITTPITKKVCKSLRFTPCLEAVILQCLSHSIPASTADAKRKFEEHFHREASHIDKNGWKRHFTKSQIQNLRTNIIELDEVIGIFENP